MIFHSKPQNFLKILSFFFKIFSGPLSRALDSYLLHLLDQNGPENWILLMSMVEKPLGSSDRYRGPSESAFLKEKLTKNGIENWNFLKEYVWKIAELLGPATAGLWI